jgi:hypothetical protein
VLILNLAAILTICASLVLFLLPLLLQHAELPWQRVFYCWLPCLAVAFAVGSYVCAFLDVTLAATAAGQARQVVWPGRDVLVILNAVVTWLVCFLAGPVLLVTVAAWYWLHCGDPTGLDWFILAELGVVAVGYWLLALLAVKERGRLLDANPMQVADLLEKLGPRAFVAALLASAILLGHGYAAASAVPEVHRQFAGVFQLAACSISGLFWATFLFRLLGVWCHLTAARR